MKKLEHKIHQVLIEKSHEKDKARLRSCTMQHASDWLTAIPNKNTGLHLKKEEF